MAMTEPSNDPMVALARSLPAVFDDEALHVLAERLRPFLDDGGDHDEAHYYTAAQAAELVGVNIETVRRAIRAGELPVSARIGRSPRLSREDVDHWLAATMEISTAGRPIRRRRRQAIQPEHSLKTTFGIG